MTFGGAAAVRRRIAVVVLVVACLAATAVLATDDLLRREVDRAVQGALRAAPATGVHLVRVETGETVYALDADRKRILASNTKLFTTAAALDVLGPGRFFETSVLARGRIVNGVLIGDVAIVGRGDPLISGREHGGQPSAIFRDWAGELRRAGIHRILGRLVLVHGFFDDAGVHPDWPDDQLDRWYEAPAGALSFSDNCVLVRVRAGRPGEPVHVDQEPDLGLFRAETSAVTTATSKGSWLVIERRTAPGEDPWTLEVRGRLPVRTERAQWVTVPDPVAWFGAAVFEAFASEELDVLGGVVSTPVLPDDAAGDWRSVLVHRSDLLAVLEIINKRSQNFFAENLLKTLGAVRCGAGTWEGGLRAVRESLDALGLDGANYRLADGSGMSRGNLATPRTVTTLLRRMLDHRWGQEFLATLPYSGEPDLSWASRLEDPPYRGNVMAKTGTLRAVSTLSGYVKGRSGTLYAFSILNNDASAVWRARSAQDAILRAVIDHG